MTTTYGLDKLGMAAIFILFLTSCAPAPSKNCGYMQNAFGENISWQGRVPVSLVVDAAHAHVAKEAADVWNGAGAGTLITIVTGLPPFPQTRDNINGIYFNETLGPSEEGRTSGYWIGDALRETDIRVSGNYKYYYDTPGALAFQGAVNLEALLIHEMGHVLGLAHSTQSTSVMYPYLDRNTDRISLTKDDVSNILCMYSH